MSLHPTPRSGLAQRTPGRAEWWKKSDLEVHDSLLHLELETLLCHEGGGALAALHVAVPGRGVCITSSLHQVEELALSFGPHPDHAGEGHDELHHQGPHPGAALVCVGSVWSALHCHWETRSRKAVTKPEPPEYGLRPLLWLGNQHTLQFIHDSHFKTTPHIIHWVTLFLEVLS